MSDENTLLDTRLMDILRARIRFSEAMMLPIHLLTNTRVAPASEDRCGIANLKNEPVTAEQNPKATRSIAEEFAIFEESLDRL